MVPSNIQIARADLARDVSFGRLLHATIPATWPPATVADALAWFVSNHEHAPDDAAWMNWYAIATGARSDTLIGSIGFFGPPTAGSVEIGYAVLPELASARRAQAATGIEFPLVEAPAEQVPLPDGAFDLAVSEYGASLWAEPALWLPEAARLLRPTGRLVFLTNSTLAYLCSPDEGTIIETLQRPQFGMYRMRFPGEEGTEYHLSHGEWIRRLHANGFEIEDLQELQAPPDAERHVYYDYVTPDWGRRWPAEEMWVARKRPAR